MSVAEEIRASELSEALKSDFAASAADNTLDDDQLLDNISIIDESKEDDEDEIVLTEAERAQFGPLIDFYHVSLLRAFWAAQYGLKQLFPWQIECLTRPPVLHQNSKFNKLNICIDLLTFSLTVVCTRQKT